MVKNHEVITIPEKELAKINAEIEIPDLYNLSFNLYENDLEIATCEEEIDFLDLPKQISIIFTAEPRIKKSAIMKEQYKELGEITLTISKE